MVRINEERIPYKLAGTDSSNSFDRSQLSTVRDASGEGRAGVTVSSEIAGIEESIAEAESELTRTITEISLREATGEGEADAGLTSSTIAGTFESVAEGEPDIPTVTETISLEEADAEAEGSVGETRYDALIGGTIRFEDGTRVEGAEIHILRDNDDTKIETLFSDENGEFETVLPGEDFNDPDPPVYSIEVWYREGEKRSSSATLFNAKNRPFLDTDDPSGSNPYEK